MTTCTGWAGIHRYSRQEGRRLVVCPVCGHAWPDYAGVKVGDLPLHERADGS